MKTSHDANICVKIKLTKFLKKKMVTKLLLQKKLELVYTFTNIYRFINRISVIVHKRDNHKKIGVRIGVDQAHDKNLSTF